ncbi:multiple sugar transport system substrate-binding protein [Enterococcus sp. DIV0421]|uniref:extracellular solute-binding protein n=1 Tax=Enterococcus sp. DIV0421 TaxID=2774688 RepID=UPI003F206450
MHLLNKYRKIFFLVPCITVIGTMSACNNNDSNSTEEKTVELTVWETSRRKDDYDTQLEEKFLKKYPWIKLKKVVKEGDPGNEFYQAVASGTAPDFVEASFSVANQLAKSEVIVPLNNYLKTWEESKEFDQNYLDILSLDSKVYGLPKEVNPMLFAYNKKLFSEKNITQPPKNWEEALDYAKKINNPDEQISGYATLTAEWTEWFFQYYVWQAGGDLTQKNPDGTIKLDFTNPAAIDAANYYKKLSDSGVLPSDRTLNFDDLLTQFSQNRIGMMPFATDWVMDVISRGMSIDNLGLSLAPVGPSGKSPTAISGTCFVINAKSSKEKQDAAWKYISFIMGKEQVSNYYKNQADKGALAPITLPRNDLKISDFGELPSEYQNVLNSAEQDSRLEFYGKVEFGSYVDRAVQNILSNPTSNPLKELKEAQKNAEAEALADFNNKINSN